MQSFVSRRTAARFVFIIGLLLMFLGGAVLIGSLIHISRLSMLVSFLFITVGIGSAFLALKLNKRSLYLFFAALFLQTGLLFFLITLRVIPIAFSQTWPLLSVFSGLALFPAGWRRYGTFRAQFVTPSVAFVVLGSTLMVFSLNLVDFSLAQFVRNWWPLLVVLAGLMLILISLGTQSAGDSKR